MASRAQLSYNGGMQAPHPRVAPVRAVRAVRIFAALLAAFLPLRGAVWAQSACPEWKDAHTTLVEVGPSEDLAAKVRDASSGTTLLLKPGTYKISGTLRFAKDDVTMRSTSGKREDVILDGNVGSGGVSGFTAELIAVSASGVTLADFSVRRARHHAIHGYAPADRPVARLRMRNLHVSDCGEQIVKVNSNGGNPLYWSDSGIVECSKIGFDDNSVMEASGSGFYTGGIDIHGGRGWIIRGNLFSNIQREGKSMEHAVHMWSKSRDCLIEGNRFENVYRAVGLGMKTAVTTLERRYPDGKGDSPYFDFIGGIVRNNTVFNKAGIHLETGIEIMNVTGTEIYHNTVYSQDKPFNSIEYRWPNTTVIIKNNLVNNAIMRRDNAQAELAGNVENAGTTVFANALLGDLGLSIASSAIGKGVPLAAGKADADIDGQARDGSPDAGADEFREGNVRILRSRAASAYAGRDASSVSPELFRARSGKIRSYRADGRMLSDRFLSEK